jgi:hypothetical protein
VIFGAHFPSRVNFRPGNVRVDVHTPRHDDQTSSIERAVGAKLRIGRRCDDAAILNPQVADFAVDTVGRVVHRSVSDANQRHGGSALVQSLRSRTSGD